MTYPSKCPECGEAVQQKAPRAPRGGGWALSVERKRLKFSHLDGEPLCPVMTPRGYQPAMPIRS